VVIRHTQTVIISRDDPLFDAVLTWCGKQQDTARSVTRWRAAVNPNTLYSNATAPKANGVCGAGYPGGGQPSAPVSPQAAVGNGQSSAMPGASSPDDMLWAMPPTWGDRAEPGSLTFLPGVTARMVHYKPSKPCRGLADGKSAKVRVRVCPHVTIGGGVVDTMEVSTLSRSPDVLRCLMEETALIAAEKKRQSATVFVSNGGDNPDPYWQMVMTRKMRSASSVILPSGMMQDILSDAKRFLADRDWYAAMGIPWRRGYGLFGPPGGGKTSLIQAVAGELGQDLYVLRLAEDGMDDNKLDRMLRGVPSGSLLLIEDIDVAKASRDRDGEDEPSGSTRADDAASHYGRSNSSYGGSRRRHGSRITQSGLLNAIDGVASADGRILFVTSNYPERLDAALIRPGRVDRRFDLGYATTEQAKRLFERFFPMEEGRQADAFASAVGAWSRTASMAELQEFLLERRDDAAQAVYDARCAKERKVD
jgi:hypothetical protein